MADRARICGEKEHRNKTRCRWLCQDGKMSECGALLVNSNSLYTRKSSFPPLGNRTLPRFFYLSYHYQMQVIFRAGGRQFLLLGFLSCRFLHCCVSTSPTIWESLVVGVFLLSMSVVFIDHLFLALFSYFYPLSFLRFCRFAFLTAGVFHVGFFALLAFEYKLRRAESALSSRLFAGGNGSKLCR